MKYPEGKRLYFYLFLAGGLADLALAPFYIFPVLLISFPLAFLATERAHTFKAAFWRGWIFGFGHFVFGLYWIAYSLLVDLRFAWLIPFAVAGIPLVLGIFTGLASVFYHGLTRHRAIPLEIKVLFFTALWVIFEYLRSIMFSGFPWNLTGYTALFSNIFAQIGSIGGVYFASLVVVFIALLPIYRRRIILVAAAVIIFCGSYIYGYYHLKTSAETASTRTANVLIYQPNIKQSLKWDPVMSKLQFVEDVEYTRKLSIKDKDIILWPETGVPYYINRQPWVEQYLQEIAPDNGVLISGGLRAEGERGMPGFKMWNTLYSISKNEGYQAYDKLHLVPFGEYVPLRKELSTIKGLQIDKITPGDADFTTGKSRDVMRFKSGPSFLPLICYEVIFPAYAYNVEKPDLLVNITNDGWFGNSTGPQQHLAMAQMRSIEQGVPLLRAANTGVSAIISPNGEIVDKLSYDVRGSIEAILHLRKINTTYNTWGEQINFGLILIILMLTLIFRIKPKSPIA